MMTRRFNLWQLKKQNYIVRFGQVAMHYEEAWMHHNIKITY